MASHCPWYMFNVSVHCQLKTMQLPITCCQPTQCACFKNNTFFPERSAKFLPLQRHHFGLLEWQHELLNSSWFNGNWWIKCFKKGPGCKEKCAKRVKINGSKRKLDDDPFRIKMELRLTIYLRSRLFERNTCRKNYRSLRRVCYVVIASFEWTSENPHPLQSNCENSCQIEVQSSISILLVSLIASNYNIPPLQVHWKLSWKLS